MAFTRLPSDERTNHNDWFLQFREKARVRFTPPLRRSPSAQRMVKRKNCGLSPAGIALLVVFCYLSEVDHGALVADRQRRKSLWSGHASWRTSQGPWTGNCCWRMSIRLPSSIATVSVRSLCRKLRQVEEGPLWRRGRCLPTLPSLTLMPSLSSSPWMRGAPPERVGRAHPADQVTDFGTRLGWSKTA
jgi:hypothetical protein